MKRSIVLAIVFGFVIGAALVLRRRSSGGDSAEA